MVLMSIVEAFCMPVFGLFYNVPWTLQFWPLLVVTALGTWGLTVVGTAFAALTANLRLRELMLPALIYPVMIPSLLAAISLSTYLAVGVALPADMWPWMKLLIGFDIIYTLLALVLTETVLVG
jgi:heme exporter protein B